MIKKIFLVIIAIIAFAVLFNVIYKQYEFFQLSKFVPKFIENYETNYYDKGDSWMKEVPSVSAGYESKASIDNFIIRIIAQKFENPQKAEEEMKTAAVVYSERKQEINVQNKKVYSGIYNNNLYLGWQENNYTIEMKCEGCGENYDKRLETLSNIAKTIMGSY